MVLESHKSATHKYGRGSPSGRRSYSCRSLIEVSSRLVVPSSKQSVYTYTLWPFVPTTSAGAFCFPSSRTVDSLRWGTAPIAQSSETLDSDKYTVVHYHLCRRIVVAGSRIQGKSAQWSVSCRIWQKSLFPPKRFLCPSSCTRLYRQHISDSPE